MVNRWSTTITVDCRVGFPTGSVNKQVHMSSQFGLTPRRKRAPLQFKYRSKSRRPHVARPPLASMAGFASKRVSASTASARTASLARPVPKAAKFLIFAATPHNTRRPGKSGFSSTARKETATSMARRAVHSSPCSPCVPLAHPGYGASITRIAARSPSRRQKASV